MLYGKVALVTGSSKGLGSKIAEVLSDYGANVIITYKSDKDNALDLQKRLLDNDGKVCVQFLDVTNEKSIKYVVDFIEKEFGRLDILINNAGIGCPCSFEDTTETIWDEHFNINLKGPFLCIKNSLKLLKESGDGRIVNVSSVAALTGGSFGPHYSASKAGLIGLTKSAAKELGKYGISVNVVAPGPIRSEMTDTLNGDTLNGILKATPLGRFAESGEVAEVICQLFNPKLNYITGQTIVVDGGRYMI